jgi:hypothetical protein
MSSKRRNASSSGGADGGPGGEAARDEQCVRARAPRVRAPRAAQEGCPAHARAPTAPARAARSMAAAVSAPAPPAPTPTPTPTPTTAAGGPSPSASVLGGKRAHDGEGSVEGDHHPAKRAAHAEPDADAGPPPHPSTGTLEDAVESAGGDAAKHFATSL